MTRGELDRYDAVVMSPLGMLGVRTQRSALSAIDVMSAGAAPIRPSTPLAVEVVDQLFQYFEDPTWRLDFELGPAGTQFQRQVWRALLDIPSGQVVRYGVLADKLGTAARAVGGACRQNPIPIVVPCHRVVAARGIGGYMGELEGACLSIKEWLLDHERSAPVRNGG